MANKGQNHPGAHQCSIAGGPGSKRKANHYGKARRMAKYLAQWARTAANKERNKLRYN